MKSFWNFIKKNGLYAFINLFGLTVSLAFVLLLAVYVNRQLTTDSFQKNADRIYIYANENFIGSAYYLQKHLLDNFPEIEKATSLFSMNAIGSLSVGEGQRVLTHKTTYADSSFFDIFSFRLLEGSNQAWKASDRSAVISKSFADTYFSDRDPIGQPLKYTSPEGDSYIFTVAAVMEDIDHSVIPYCDVLCRAEVLTGLNAANNESMDNSGGFDTFIMTWPDADIQSRIPDIREYLGKTWWIYSWNMVDKVFFIPLRDLYFYNRAESLAGNILQGDRRLVGILMAACIILLLFAVLNYINLTVAQSGRRAKEMATRRLLGSSRNGIMSRMIFEATVFAVRGYIHSSGHSHCRGAVTIRLTAAGIRFFRMEGTQSRDCTADSYRCRSHRAAVRNNPGHGHFPGEAYRHSPRLVQPPGEVMVRQSTDSAATGSLGSHDRGFTDNVLPDKGNDKRSAGIQYGRHPECLQRHFHLVGSGTGIP